MHYKYLNSIGVNDEQIIELALDDDENIKYRNPLGTSKYYIQSALTVSEEEKRLQEVRPYSRTPDSFKKIVIIKDNIIPWLDENGILYNRY